MIQLITFDCAQTLVEVDWNVRSFIETCGRDVGLRVESDAYDRYARKVQAHWPEYLKVNLERSEVAGQAFWDRIARSWLVEEGLDAAFADEIRVASLRLGFSEESVLFRIYPDVPDCLADLRSRGLKLAVVSNWDYTLHRVLRMFGVYEAFDAVYASLEEGVEKPDPRFFEICLRKFQASAAETVHIGDNPIDDLQGAQAAGIRPLLILRDPNVSGGDLRTLSDLPKLLWPNG